MDGAVRECAATDIADAVCDGAWEYHAKRPCKVRKRDRQCGVERPASTIWVPEERMTTLPFSVTTRKREQKICVSTRPERFSCDNVPLSQCTGGCKVQTRCTVWAESEVRDMAQARLEIERDSVMNQIRSRGHEPSQFRFNLRINSATSGCQAKWQGQVEFQPTLVEQESPEVLRECELDDPSNVTCLDAKLRYSSAGLTREQLNSSKNPHADKLRCLTCDHVSQADPVAMAKCLFDARAELARGFRPAGVDIQAARKQLVAKTQALYELKGPALARATIPGAGARTYADDAIDLYLHEGALPACGQHSTLPDACGAPLVRELELCWRLSAKSAAPDNAIAQARRCLGLAVRASAAPQGCDQRRLIDSYRQIVVALFEKTAGAPPETEQTPEGPRPTVASLRKRLGLVQTFYAAFPGSAEREWTHGKLSWLLGKVWDAAYDSAGWGASQSELDLASRSIEVERRMLLAALGEKEGEAPVLVGLPLLVVLGDGFRGLATRARSVAGVHDFGCQLLGCQGTVGAESEALWSMWARLSNPVELDKATLAARNLQGSKPILSRWQPVFDSVERQSSAIVAAVREALEQPSGAPTVDLATLQQPVVPLARELAAFVQEAASRWDSFEKTGFLDWTALASRSASHALALQSIKTAPRLVAGLDRARVSAKRDELGRRNTDFATRIEQYRSGQLQVMREWQTDLKLSAETRALFEEAQRKSDLIAYAVADVEGLGNSADQARYQLGEFANQFEAAMTAAAANAEYQPQQLPELPVSAVSARYDGTPLSAFAHGVLQDSKVWTVQAKRGDVLRFQISGQWAPTCAVRRAKLGSPGGSDSIIVPPNALTTSEGYLVQWTGSGYEAVSKAERTSDSKSSGDSLTGSACAGLQASCCNVGIATVGAYARAEGCISGHMGNDHVTASESATTNGGEVRRSLSASTGLRARGTPFESHPAGSLILAHRSASGAIIGQVLTQPQSAVVIEVDADYFLVVNDKQGCPDASPSKLTVQAVLLKSATSNGEKLKKGMSDALDKIRLRLPELVKQGRLVPNELAALRSGATEAFRSSFGVTIDQIPPTLRSFFEALLDAALVDVSRSVEIQSLDRTIAIQMSELTSLRAAVEADKEQSRLSRSIARSLLADIDGIRLEATTAELAALIREEVLPVLDLRFPKVRERLLTQNAADLRELQQAGLTSSGVQLAASVLRISKAIDTLWQSEISLQPTIPESIQVVVGLPRPGRTSAGGYSNRMDPGRSQAFWRALESEAPDVTLSLRPEDLYRSGGLFVLGCKRANPVIEDLRVVFLNGTPAEDRQGLTIDAAFGRELTFLDDKGVRGYVIGSEEILGPQLPIGFEQSVQRAFANTTLLYAGAGLSPFNNVTIPTKALRDPEIKELILGTGSSSPGASDALVALKLSFLQLSKPVSTPACK